MNIEGENPFLVKKRSSRVRTILLVSFGILLLLGGIVFYSRSRRSTIVVTGQSAGFTVTINGVTVRSEKTSRGLEIPIYSGVYRIKIDREQYSSFTADVTVPTGTDVIVHPSFVLLPSSSETAQQGIDFVRPSPDQRSLYYLGAGRTHLFRLEIGNQVPIQLTDNPLSEVSDVQWSNDPNVAIVETPDSTSLYEIPKYDFTNQKIAPIGGKEIISPVWDPVTGARIAAAYFTAGGEKSLVVADKTFTKIDRKTDLSAFNDPKLVWSTDGRYILVINRSANAAQNNMWLYSLGDATFQQVTTDGSIIDASFNPDSSIIAFEQIKADNAHALMTYRVSDNKITDLAMNSSLKLTAWKDSSHFYGLSPQNGGLVLIGLDATQVSQNFTFPAEVKGIFYSSPSSTLIYYTDDAVYTVGLDN
jgi:dipeptidyl aminopeptidase/acylaminoacyl peptidase